MTGQRAALGGRGPLATALGAAGAWLLEPAQPAAEPVVSAPAALRPVVAVFGLSRGCGVTVVARALAAELASRDANGAAAVHCEARAAGIPLATRAAGQLARMLADVPGADTRAVGQLCLVGGAERSAVADTARHFAPLVLDAGATALGGVPAAMADEVVVVASPFTEPALAAVPWIAWSDWPPAGRGAESRGRGAICTGRGPTTAGPRWAARPHACRTRAWAPSSPWAVGSRAGSLGQRSPSSPTAARAADDTAPRVASGRSLRQTPCGV